MSPPGNLSSHDLAFDVALREAACAARHTYPDDDTRISRALALIRAGHVTLTAQGALVKSGSSPRVYTVNGTCQCQGYTSVAGGRCSHRYAVSLSHKAQALLPQLHFATLTRQDERQAWGDLPGIAVVEGERVRFYAEDALDAPPLTIHQRMRCPWLVLGGNCGLALAQATADGTGTAPAPSAGDCV